MSGPKGRKVERKIPGILGSKTNALHSMCSASMEGLTLGFLVMCVAMESIEGFNCRHEGCSWGLEGENSPPKLLV